MFMRMKLITFSNINFRSIELSYLHGELDVYAFSRFDRVPIKYPMERTYIIDQLHLEMLNLREWEIAQLPERKKADLLFEYRRIRRICSFFYLN